MALKDTQISKTKALDEYQVVLAQEGDKIAFELLYRRWHAKLLRFAFRQTNNTDAAEDVMQEAALTIAKNITRLDDPSLFGPWAYTIVRRRAADYIARVVKERRIKTEIEQRPAPQEGLTPEDALSVKQALLFLPSADRLLLKLFYNDGMSGPEIAAGMGLPLGTIKSRLFSAREKLRLAYNIHPKGDKK